MTEVPRAGGSNLSTSTNGPEAVVNLEGSLHANETASTSTSTTSNPNPVTNTTINRGGTVPGIQLRDSTTGEWRFELNFPPEWLLQHQDSPTLGLAALNDWVRNSIGRTNNPAVTIPARQIPNMVPPIATQSFENRTNSSNGTEGPPTYNNGNGNGNFVRGSRTVPGSRGMGDSEIPSSLGSSRRDSNSFVIDVDESNPDWQGPSVGNNGPGSPGAGGRRNDGIGDGDGDGDGIPDPEGNGTERSAAEILRQSPEVRACLVVIERYFPFLLIILVKGLFDHGGGIIMFAALVITFSHTNTILKKEVAKQGKRSVPYLFMVSVNLILCIIFMYYVFKTDFLHPALVFLPTELPLDNVSSLLWLVLVTDYVAKFITIIIKAIIICLPESVIPFQKRGKHYLFVESTSQLYRSLLPICPWLGYLFGAYEGTFKLLSILLCMFYLMCKVVDVVQRLRRWKIAFRKLLQPVHYGTTPTEEELVDLFCPICHDSFTAPTKLSCSHIFCEECVSTWLDRGERSCPMCRARVADDTSWRDGSTSHFIQIY